MSKNQKGRKRKPRAITAIKSIPLKDIPDGVGIDFLDILAHELKAPLTSIIGLTEVLQVKKSVSATEVQDSLSIIHREAFRLKHLINRISTVNRFESGREKVFLESFELNSFLSSYLPNLKMIAKNNHSKIVFNIDKKIKYKITSDKNKIIQILYNFVENADKYGSKGQTITISVDKVKNNWIKVAVSDQGKGISKNFQKKIFNKFVQSKDTISRSCEGIGLGLYICKIIVDMLGGEIGVESKLGRGSTFYFTLPVKKASKLFLKNNNV